MERKLFDCEQVIGYQGRVIFSVRLNLNEKIDPGFRYGGGNQYESRYGYILASYKPVLSVGLEINHPLNLGVLSSWFGFISD
ncbi:hypothetical protein L1987_03638 [Smallanthus sonchifolius]|uniref:Uncharacterized protein n=1 Tax=Smallanthus sonchifolius TaxID=185202 RepID=A0ACB9KB91_9ASTR|nr:hypothetical protein L1987_03638 [Smallanthus sonchifolius]